MSFGLCLTMLACDAGTYDDGLPDFLVVDLLSPMGYPNATHSSSRDVVVPVRSVPHALEMTGGHGNLYQTVSHERLRPATFKLYCDAAHMTWSVRTATAWLCLKSRQSACPNLHSPNECFLSG